MGLPLGVLWTSLQDCLYSHRTAHRAYTSHFAAHRTVPGTAYGTFGSPLYSHGTAHGIAQTIARDTCKSQGTAPGLYHNADDCACESHWTAHGKFVMPWCNPCDALLHVHVPWDRSLECLRDILEAHGTCRGAGYWTFAHHKAHGVRYETVRRASKEVSHRDV